MTLVIRRAQLEAFREEARRQFEVAQAKRLVAEGKQAELSAALELVRAALPRASGWGLAVDAELVEYLDACAALGIGFEDRVAAAKVALEDRSVAGWIRVRRAVAACE